MRAPQQGEARGPEERAQATRSQVPGPTSEKESANSLCSRAAKLSISVPSPRPRITLSINPDEQRTTEFFRWLIGEARAWDNEQRKDSEAA